MSKAVIKHLEGDGMFTFSFLLEKGDLSIQFNLHRPLDETYQHFSTRLNTQVVKMVAKKLMKMKQKAKYAALCKERRDFVEFKEESGLPLEIDEATTMKV